MSLYHKGFLSSSLYPDLISSPSVLSFLQCTRCMPLEWRKAALTVTRVQSDPSSNTRLRRMLDPIYSSNLHIINPETSIPYSPGDFIDPLSVVARSNPLCSLISSNETLEDIRSMICGGKNRTVHRITCIKNLHLGITRLYTMRVRLEA